jgi:hypothetical protein
MTCIDTYGFVIREKTPIYWRAWEYVSNYNGSDASFAPFKPLSIYKKTGTGDLLNAIRFRPHPNEIKPQIFITDEYGYRNEPGFLNKPIDALVIGSSFVAGAAETQRNLISEILTRDYGIRTYNYSTSVQYAWEDYRFEKNKPKYIFIVEPDGEVISSQWKYQLIDREPTNKPQKWNSYEEWKKANEPLPKAYDKWAALLDQYSLIKHYAIEAEYYILDALYSREEIARQTRQSMVSYEPSTKMLFWQPDYDIPLLGSSGKTNADINAAIAILKDTQIKLRSRNIRLIIVSLPSKPLAEMEKYKKIEKQKTAFYALNQAMEKAGIEHVDMQKPIQDYRKRTNMSFYYPNDTHWSAQANYLISKEIARYIESNE